MGVSYTQSITVILMPVLILPQALFPARASCRHPWRPHGRAGTDQPAEMSRARPAIGDWGDHCPDDRKENELSLREAFAGSQSTR